MDPRLKESISALMDDEANELELQRVLSHLDESDVQEAWQRYHLVRDVMKERGLDYSTNSKPSLNIDVTASVAAAIAEQDAPPAEAPAEIVPERAESRWRWVGMGAIAASVLFAAVLFVQQNAQQPVIPQVAERDVESDTSPSTAVHAKQPRIVEQLDASQVRRLNEYLLRHAEHSIAQPGFGMAPLARVASVNSVGI